MQRVPSFRRHTPAQIADEPFHSILKRLRAEEKRISKIRRRSGIGPCCYRRIRIPISEPLGPGKGAHAGPHLQLKLSAVAWLKGLGKPDVVTEYVSHGYIPDVASEHCRIGIECGWTQEDKMISMARNGVLMIWLPYCWNGEFQVGDLAPAVAVTNFEYRLKLRNSWDDYLAKVKREEESLAYIRRLPEILAAEDAARRALIEAGHDPFAAIFGSPFQTDAS